MKGSDLPENPAEWPGDPYAVLGVTRSAEWKVIRRAYAARIKAYKPEQAPEAFQKIRAAYELLQRFQDQAAPFAPLITPIEAPPPPPSKDSNGSQSAQESRQPDFPRESEPVSSAEPQPEPHERTPAEPTAPPAIDPPAEQSTWRGLLHEIHTRIQQGEIFPAYQELMHLEQDHPGEPELCLPLFWLLQLRPELNPGMRPLQWLFKSLLHCPQPGPVWDVCQQELRLASYGALLDECWTLIQTLAGSELSQTLLQFRVQEQVRFSHWELLLRETQSLKDALQFSGNQSWPELLFQIVELSIWEKSEGGIRAFAWCHHELLQMEEMFLPLAYRYQRLETLKEAYTSLEKGQQNFAFPKAWLKIIRLAWRPYDPEFVVTIRDTGSRWLQQSELTYQLLTSLQSCSMANLEQLQHALNVLVGDQLWISSDRMEQLLERIHQQIEWPSLILREYLFALCIREQVVLSDLLNALAATPENSKTHFLQQSMRSDVALNVLILGILASRLPDLDE